MLVDALSQGKTRISGEARRPRSLSRTSPKVWGLHKWVHQPTRGSELAQGWLGFSAIRPWRVCPFACSGLSVGIV